jgi:transcription antitermination factor NusG
VPLLKREVDLFPEDLFAAPLRGRPWRVAYVRSRQEKGLARHLRERRVPFYLPQQEKVVRRQGRSRVSFLPLFPGYVFFRAPRLEALRSNLVCQVLEVPDQGELERELRSLWQLQEAGAPLVPHPYLGPGDEVEIVDGPLRGWSGTILREKGRLRLVVSIRLLRQAVAAELDREVVAPLGRRPRRPLAAAG